VAALADDQMIHQWNHHQVRGRGQPAGPFVIFLGGHGAPARMVVRHHQRRRVVKAGEAEDVARMHQALIDRPAEQALGRHHPLAGVERRRPHFLDLTRHAFAEKVRALRRIADSNHSAHLCRVGAAAKGP